MRLFAFGPRAMAGNRWEKNYHVPTIPEFSAFAQYVTKAIQTYGPSNIIFVSGGALGADLVATRAAIPFKKEGLRILTVLPKQGYWNPSWEKVPGLAQQIRDIQSQSNKVISPNAEGSIASLLFKRVKLIVDALRMDDVAIGIWDGVIEKNSGTSNTMTLLIPLIKKGLKVLIMDPYLRQMGQLEHQPGKLILKLKEQTRITCKCGVRTYVKNDQALICPTCCDGASLL